MSDLLAILDTAMKSSSYGDVELYAEKGRSSSVSMMVNDIKTGKSLTYQGVGVRVVADGKLGFASVNDLEIEALKKAISEAESIAKVAPSNPFLSLPDPVKIPEMRGLFDPALAEVETGEVLGMAQSILKRSLADDRIRLDSGEVTCASSEMAIMTSKGITSSYKSSIVYSFLMGMASESGDVGSFDYVFDAQRKLDGFDLNALSDKFVKKVLDGLHAVRPEPFTGTVVLSPMPAGSVVVNPMLFSMSAENVQKGLSRFAGQAGEQVASEAISISDRPSLADGLNTRPFDREGVAALDLATVKDGVLNEFFYNTMSANREERASNGRASGGFRAVPSVGSTNTVIEPGTRSLESLISEIDHGLYVNRVSGAPNPVSGQFSGVCKGAKLITNGQFAESAKEIMISGQVFDIMKNVTAVSLERDQVFSSLLPNVVVPEMKVFS